MKRATNSFSSHFGANNTFHFIVPQYDEEYLEFALNLKDFIENDKIEEYRERVSEHYNTILRSVDGSEPVRKNTNIITTVNINAARIKVNTTRFMNRPEIFFSCLSFRSLIR